jgi:putative FmdB family regulatory protein
MIYTYRCNECGNEQDERRSMAERDDCPTCIHCVSTTRRIITAVSSIPPMGGHDNPGYVSPMSGDWIDSRRKRRNEMDKYDCQEKE